MPLGLLELFAGGKPLTVTLDGLALDNDKLGPVSIVRGRASAEERPKATVVSFAVKAEALVALPELGDPVVVDLSDDLLDALGGGEEHRRRFTGTVTDAAIRPSAEIVTIVAAGDRSRAARVPIGDVPWPAELDGARATRILAALVAADPTFDVLPGDPGTVTVLARDVDRQPAAALLDDLAAFTGGDAWETRAGELTWRDARSRSDLAPGLTLDASNVLVDPEFTKSLDGLVTDLTVYYGPDPQASIRLRDTAAPITTLAAQVSTPLATASDAQAYATEVVGRRSRPAWSVPALGVDVLRTLDPAQRLALLAAEPGLLVALTGMPTTAPFSASQLWVEGWRETYTRQSWRFAISVTPRGLTGAQARWIDVPATYVPAAAPGDPLPAPQPMTWAAQPFAGLSWIAVAGWWTDEEITLGRWADVPANVRWGNYPAGTTWGDLA